MIVFLWVMFGCFVVQVIGGIGTMVHANDQFKYHRDSYDRHLRAKDKKLMKIGAVATVTSPLAILSAPVLLGAFSLYWLRKAIGRVMYVINYEVE